MGHVLSMDIHCDAGLLIVRDSPNNTEELSSWPAGMLCSPNHMSLSG